MGEERGSNSSHGLLQAAVAAAMVGEQSRGKVKVEKEK